jgi:phosphoribosylaminoimidazolecarboxamide formyltransferase/IMP cyclohydrolase
MAEAKKMKTALISVFHKDGLEELLRKLNEEGVKLLSTGGTQSFIESLGYECQKVEEVTTYPSILGGRVKTLHPKVFGGILGRRDNEGDREQMTKYGIPEIDLVVVDLYPFEQTVASGADVADIIEKIDIGGIALIRAAAKNFKDVVIVPSKGEYGVLLDILNRKGAVTDIDDRCMLAERAFGVSSHYDTAIHSWFEKVKSKK